MSSGPRVLFAKEWKQVTRNKGAVATATAFPVLFLLVIPLAQAIAVSQGLMVSPLGGVPMPPGLMNASPETLFSEFTFPLYLVFGGLVVPSVASVFTIVNERERRTIDLLLALPLSMSQIVTAKVGAVVLLSMAITLPLVVLDFAVLAYLGLAGAALLAAYTFEFLAAVTFSVCSTVVVALLAKDYRSANNLSGAFIGPVILVTIAFNLLLPAGIYRPVLLGAILFAVGFVILIAALKVVSLERYAL